MNEFPTILSARQFLRDAGNDSVPVDIERLAAAANAKIKVAYDFADDESGQTTRHKGRHLIIVNGNHREERQRFTVLHEIAHIVLGLPSQHHGSTLRTDVLLRYGKRPEEEVLCDVFAAECLLPYHPFAEQVADTDISLDAVKSLAEEYKASLTTTGSRFAVNASEPCAFVLSEDERIRYVSRSKFLNELKGWINFDAPVPQGSVAQRLIQGSSKIVTTRPCYQRHARRERSEWPPAGCNPGSPWTADSLRFGNRLRRTCGCGSTPRLSA